MKKRSALICFIMIIFMVCLTSCNNKKKLNFKGSVGDDTEGRLFLSTSVWRHSSVEDDFAVTINYGRNAAKKFDSLYSIYVYNEEETVKILDCASDFGTNEGYLSFNESSLIFDDVRTIYFELYEKNNIDQSLKTADVFKKSTGMVYFILAPSDFTLANEDDIYNYAFTSFEYLIENNTIKIKSEGSFD